MSLEVLEPNISEFMYDSKYVDEFKVNQKNQLWKGLLMIQSEVNGLSPNLQKTITDISTGQYFDLETNAHADKLKSMRFKDLKKEVSYLKNHLDKTIADFGYSRYGLPTGLVSTKIVTFDKNGLDKSKHPVKEHFFPLGQVGSWIMIWDCLIGRWKIMYDKDGRPFYIKGLNYINQVYPTFHLTAWTTHDENIRLISIVNNIIKRHTTNEGIINWDLVREDLKVAKHYKEAGITFQKQLMTVNNLQPIHPSLIPREFRELQTGKQIKSTHKYW